MDKLLEGIKETMAESVNVCTGCGAESGVESVELIPLDPIDHSKQHLPLCPQCREWAESHNEIAVEIGEQLRAQRAEIGGRYSDRLLVLWGKMPEGLQADKPGIAELLER